jgi:hypothetical protein
MIPPQTYKSQTKRNKTHIQTSKRKENILFCNTVTGQLHLILEERIMMKMKLNFPLNVSLNKNNCFCSSSLVFKLSLFQGLTPVSYARVLADNVLTSASAVSEPALGGAAAAFSQPIRNKWL